MRGAWAFLVCVACRYSPAPVVVDASPDDVPDVPDDQDAGPVLVQENAKVVESGTGAAIVLPAMPRAGNVLVMIGAANQGPLTSVTGGGSTWTRAAQSIQRSNIEVWFGTTNGSSASVAVNRTGSTGSIWLAVSEWSGLRPMVDASDVADATDNTVSVGPITTNTRDLVIFAVTDESAGVFGTPTQGPAQGPFAIVVGGVIRQSAWSGVVSTPGDYSAEVSNSGNDWDAALVAFQIAP